MSSPTCALTALCGCTVYVLQAGQVSVILRQLAVAPEHVWGAPVYTPDAAVFRLSSALCPLGSHQGNFAYRHRRIEGLSATPTRIEAYITCYTGNSWQCLTLAGLSFAGRLDEVMLTSQIENEGPRPLYVGMRWSSDTGVRYRVAMTGGDGEIHLKAAIAAWYGEVADAQREVLVRMYFSYLLPPQITAQVPGMA